MQTSFLHHYLTFIFMIALPEPSTTTMAPTPVSETTLLAPSPSPTEIPGEIMDNIAEHCLCVCVFIIVCVEWVVVQ